VRSILSWILGIPLAVIVVWFAISNLDPLTLKLNLLPFEVVMPAFLAIFATFVMGFVAGALVAWLSAGRHRRALKAERRRAEGLDREINQMKGRTIEADRRMAAGQPPLPDVPA
jgi:uncharacterized integral membrane protein